MELVFDQITTCVKQVDKVVLWESKGKKSWNVEPIRCNHTCTHMHGKAFSAESLKLVHNFFLSAWKFGMFSLASHNS